MASLQKQLQVSEARAAGSEQAAAALQQDLSSWQARYKRKDADLATQTGKVIFLPMGLLVDALIKPCICAPNRRMCVTLSHSDTAACSLPTFTSALNFGWCQHVGPTCCVHCYTSAFVSRLA